MKIRTPIILTITFYLLLVSHNESVAQIPCDKNYIKDGYTENVGIQKEDPEKLLHLYGMQYSYNCNKDICIKLDFESSACGSYWGHLALLTGSNLDYYSKLSYVSRSWSDFVLQTSSDPSCDYNSDIILTSRTPYGHLRFASTPPPGNEDYERMTITPAGSYGINNHIPDAVFQVTNGSVIFDYIEDEFGNPIPIPGNPFSCFTPTKNDGSPLGDGFRFMWVPYKSSIRSGIISETHSDYWNDENIGDNSFACGKDVMAKAPGSIALGYEAVADKLAIPENDNGSIAIGGKVKSEHYSSLVLGYESESTGPFTYVIGKSSIANYSTGYNFVLGNYVIANGGYSTAIGNYVSTYNGEGSVVIGDHSTFDLQDKYTVATGTNQLLCRFSGSETEPAYRFWTNKEATMGVKLDQGDAQWKESCDRKLKENIKKVDNSRVLASINNIPIFTWKYKEARDYHIGPMAQDFHKEFPKLSEDSTYLTNYDLAGSNMAAIKALLVVNNELEKENAYLEKINSKLEIKITTLEQKIEKLNNTNIERKNDDILLEFYKSNSPTKNSIIKYYIPGNSCSIARLIVKNDKGETICEGYIDVNQPGAFNIKFNKFKSGIYYCNINLNGSNIRRKKILIY